jgi:hypothetical protein
MSEGTVKQWCKMFKDGQTNVHDEDWSGQPSVVSNDLVQSNDQKICERQRFTISELSCEFPQISCTVLYEIITVRPGYHKFCARWVPEMSPGAHKMCRMASALTFLEQYNKDGDEFLHHIIWVTGDETWVSFLNDETREQSMQWMNTYSPNMPKNIACLPESWWQLFSGTGKQCWWWIHATMDHNNVRSVLQNAKKTA